MSEHVSALKFNPLNNFYGFPIESDSHFKLDELCEGNFFFRETTHHEYDEDSEESFIKFVKKIHQTLLEDSKKQNNKSIAKIKKADIRNYISSQLNNSDTEWLKFLENEPEWAKRNLSTLGFVKTKYLK